MSCLLKIGWVLKEKQNKEKSSVHMSKKVVALLQCHCYAGMQANTIDILEEKKIDGQN
jgi:hypothetical protein